MYKEVFYWSHYYIVKYIKGNKDPIESACLAVCLLMFINISLLVSIVEYFFDFQFDIRYLNIEERYSVKSYIVALILMLPFLLFNYIYIYRKKSREKIFAHYSSLSKERQIRGKVFYWVYVIGSIFLYFSIIFYINNEDNDVDLPIKQELIFEKFSPPAEPVRLY